MKRVFGTVGIVVAIALLACMASSVAAGGTTISLLNPPPDDLLELDVGQTYTFEIQVTSSKPFILAMVVPDVYYPGRAIIFRGNDIAHHGNTATLHLTMTGKGSTADFDMVCDWPEPGTEPGTECWPEGTVPVSIVVGVRYKGGVVVSERFNFAVVVP